MSHLDKIAIFLLDCKTFYRPRFVHDPDGLLGSNCTLDPREFSPVRGQPGYLDFGEVPR